MSDVRISGDFVVVQLGQEALVMAVKDGEAEQVLPLIQARIEQRLTDNPDRVLFALACLFAVCNMVALVVML